MEKTTRRSFLAATSVSALAAPAFLRSASADEEASADAAPESLFASPVVLQNPTETSMQAVWTVAAECTGWVEYGTSPDKLDQVSHGPIFGLRPFSDRVISIPMTGLKANTTYYYRAATHAIAFKGAYNVKPDGEPEYTEVKSFTTPGPDAKTASFCVINDTHQAQDTMAAEFALISKIKPDYTLWNGDSVNSVEGHETLQNCVMFPAKTAIADDHPLLFCRGNHDTRGIWSRNYPQYFTPWKQSDPEFAGLGYSFVVRHGDLAIIGLDTGEDKPDYRDEWGTLAEFEPYIAKQGEWLAKAIESEAVKTAKFVVAFCHIPLFDDSPKANPGTLATGFSSWKKLGADFWGPSLQKAGVQLVVAAHVHHHRVDPATEDRCWAQVTGGGPQINGATVISGRVENDRLKLEVFMAKTGEKVTEMEFEPRKIG